MGDGSLAGIILIHPKGISLFRLSNDYRFGQLTYSRFCTSPYSNSLFIKFLNDYLERKKKKKKMIEPPLVL